MQYEMKRNKVFLLFLFFIIAINTHSKNVFDKRVIKDFYYYDITCISKNNQQIHITGLTKDKLLLSGYDSLEMLGEMFYRHAYYMPDLVPSSSEALEQGIFMQETIDKNSTHYTLKLDSTTTLYVQYCRIKGEYVKQNRKKHIGMSSDFINIYKNIKYPKKIYILKKIIAIEKA